MGRRWRGWLRKADVAGTDVNRFAASERGSESQKLLGFLAGLATDLAAAFDLSALLQHVIRSMNETLGFESCAVSLLERHDGNEVLAVKAGSGLRAAVTGMRFPRGQGLIWKVMETQTPVLVPDLHADSRVIRKDAGVRSGIYAPLVSRSRTVGVLSAYKADVNAFTEPDLHLLTVVARYIASSVELNHAYDDLKAMATTDGLTGIANRRVFIERLEQEIARSERTTHPLSIVLFDLDGFKAINDTYGHCAGDAFLIHVGRALSHGLRKVDVAARYGGDEFVLLLPETGEPDAHAGISRLHGVTIPVAQRTDVSVDLQFSWGSATWPADGASADDLLRVADVRLYRMKEAHGRLPGPRA